MSTLKVMSFNIRVEAECDGINFRPHRYPRILDTLQREAPDLVGFQEVSDVSREWLRGELPEYTLLGCGRLCDYRGESAPLAFRRDRFELIKSETFWLSDTPALPGSRYENSDQSGCPRTATAALLKPRDLDGLILYINTHTDHVGQKARVRASEDLLAYIEKAGLPAIVTGDLNATPDSDEIRMLCASMTDATASLGGTFHDFGRKTGDAAIKIDYIFTSLPADISRAYAIEDQPADGVYISDHKPVVAFIDL